MRIHKKTMENMLRNVPKLNDKFRLKDFHQYMPTLMTRHVKIIADKNELGYWEKKPNWEEALMAARGEDEK